MIAPLLLSAALTVLPGNNMPLVEAEVDGKSCTLLVDTGASHTTLDLAFVTNALPSVVLNEVRLEGRTNVVAAPKFAALSTLTLDGRTLDIDGVMTLDLSHLTRAMGRRVDGILGMNHLRLKPTLISLKRGEIILEPTATELEGFHRVLTRDRGTTLELVVKLPSGQILPLLVDTGSSFTFLNRDLWTPAKDKVRFGTSDVNESRPLDFERGEEGMLDLGHGYQLRVRPILTGERGRNQLGADLFLTTDILLTPAALELR